MDELSVEVTYNCAHNCIMCSSSACHPSPLHNEMNEAEIENLLYTTKNSSLNPKNFSISGGDPLQLGEGIIFRIMKYANILGYKNLLYTTGQRTESDGAIGHEVKVMTEVDAKRLKELDVKMIFDLQAPDEKACDKIMGTDGYFENVIHAIKLCKDVGLEVETHFVPMTVNFKYFFDYLDLAKELGVSRVSYLRFVRQGRGNQNPHLEISKKQFKELQYMFIRAEEEYSEGRNLGGELINPLIRLGHPIDRRFLIDPHYPVKVCRGATDAPLITPEGNIYTCPAWKNISNYVAGNVRNENIEKVMKGSKYYNIFHDFIHTGGYKNIVGKCQECPYLSRCRGGCVAQRLLFNSTKNIQLEEAIKLGSDPLCFWGETL